MHGGAAAEMLFQRKVRGKWHHLGFWATSGLQSPRRTPPSLSPNLNTLIVLDMHRFGVATLHQLRGQVGRGGVQAHAATRT